MNPEPRTYTLAEFGAELKIELDKASYSLANFAKHTGGISKGDVRDFVNGVKAPDKLATKKIVHCFPILMKYEYTLRHAQETQSQVRTAKPKRALAHSKTRLQVAPRVAARACPAAPRLEIVRQHEVSAPLLSQPLAVVLAPALKKTRAEMLTELTALVRKKLVEADDYDFTVKNDGAHLVVKLRLAEAHSEDMVDSGCYIAVGPREPHGLGVFCKTMTSGNFFGMEPRVVGVAQLLDLARTLHDKIKDRRFET